MDAAQGPTRVLVVSHNAFNGVNNMGRTLAGLFSGMRPEELAQLFFHDDTPEPGVAGRYFKITDMDVLRSAVTRRPAGQPLENAADAAGSAYEKKAYALGRQRKPYQFLLRNAVWRLGRWYTPALRAWLRDFAPEVIFFAAGGYGFAYDVARKLSAALGIPLVTYFADDYYFADTRSRAPLYRLVRRGIRASIARCVAASAAYVCISPKMRGDYEKEFKKPGALLMTPAQRISPQALPPRSVFSEEDPFVIAYFGRLGLGRGAVLAALGRAVRAAGLPAALHVYTMETQPAFLREMTQENGVVLHGALPPEAVFAAMQRCDAVLHVESMSPENIERTRYSTSTKIPDMLGCGVPAVACGPAGINSVDYLRSTDTALVITDIGQAADGVKRLFGVEYRKTLVENALALARENHDPARNRETLARILREAAGACADAESIVE